MQNIVLTGTGSYIPNRIISNDYFLEQEFYDDNNNKFEISNSEIIEKFKSITGIEERRWAEPHQNNSDLAALAAQEAIEDAGLDKESLDYIIVGQNAGEVTLNSNQGVGIPSVASLVKQKLNIQNNKSIAYDLLFGCPGWLQGVIHMYGFMRAGMIKKAVVIGSETLSRIIDVHDRDSMIFADGAGATVFEVKEEEEKRGILSYAALSDCVQGADYLGMDKSLNLDIKDNIKYVRMKGRKIYEYALTNVPAAMKEALDKSGCDINDVKKIFIHQANEKMDDAIIKRFYRLFGMREYPKDIAPMSISFLGNSSVATIPTLIDLVLKNKMENISAVKKGDIAIFASVGAGMNINAIVYKF